MCTGILIASLVFTAIKVALHADIVYGPAKENFETRVATSGILRTMSEQKKFAWLRIAFGVVWGIDAYFKWQPDFFENFTSYLSGSLEGQPLLTKSWINLWIHMVGVDPHFFALLVAIAETAIALALIFGVASRITTWGGIAMSLVIWSTAEGFGGPYTAGSTDIGAAVMYVFVFLALWFGHAWEDMRLKR